MEVLKAYATSQYITIDQATEHPLQAALYSLTYDAEARRLADLERKKK